MIRENLEWLIVMLRNPDASVEARNHRQVAIKELCLFDGLSSTLPIIISLSFHRSLFFLLVRNQLC